MKKSRPVSNLSTLYLSFTLSCFLLPLVLIFTVSCSKERSVRKYKESVTPVGMSRTHSMQQKTTAAPAHPDARSGHFSWDTPEGWIESPKTSGMRLAAFTVKDGEKEAVCTIITLRGEAGGLKANVMRWLGQIAGPTTAGEETVNNLLDKQEKFLTDGKFPAVFIDFNPITPTPQGKSILATVISVQGNSVFIKMTGEKSILEKNKPKFKSLCKSFTLKSLQPGA